jgi:sugar lactone lactonase YvrE
MLPTLRKKGLTLFLFLLLANVSFADAYSDARAELIAAYRAQDYAEMQLAADKALNARPGYPGALFNLAFAKSLGGDSAAALEVLSSLVATGVDYGVADIEEFAALQSLPGWQSYADAVTALQAPIGEATVAFTYEVGDFVPEGIVAIDGGLLLGSIRHGSIVRVGDSSTTISSAEESGHWGVFGMRLGPDGGLWFASAAIPEYAAIDDDSAGSTGLYRLDLDSGQVTARAVLPKHDEPRVLGDLVFADDNTIYATESLTGALYRYTISSNELLEVIAPGSLRSMQGLVLDDSKQFLYVSDYVGGLFRVRLSDYTIERVTSTGPVSLFGIDGLYRYGNELIAIQNGIRPNRVAAFTLGADGTSITGSRIIARNLPEFDEPTLGTIVGDDFLFVANSHWNRFDRDANLPDGLSGPIVLRIKL